MGQIVKLEVTSTCPTCTQEHKRIWPFWEDDNGEIFIQPGILGGCMCEECVKKTTDEHGNLIITMRGPEYWLSSSGLK